MSDNVINFPKRTGSTDEKIPVKELLEEILKVGDTFESILVCGFSKSGVFYYISSEGDLKENAWILENAKISLQDLILNPEE